MSQKEVHRFEVIKRVMAGGVEQGQAAQLLGLSTRQVKRLCRSVRERGAQSLISTKRGRPSNRRIADEQRERFVQPVRCQYVDVGPHLAHERALLQLHIEPICARSPQAKGRVERLSQTLQDRMCKAMCLKGIDEFQGATQAEDHTTQAQRVDKARILRQAKLDRLKAELAFQDSQHGQLRSWCSGMLLSKALRHVDPTFMGLLRRRLHRVLDRGF